MSLGKRFIPVIATDDGDGTEFTTTMYDVEAVAANVHRGYQGCHHVRTLAVDLGDPEGSMTTADLAATVDRMERHAIAVRLAELGRQMGEP